MAAAPNGKAVPAERIATAQGIPLNFLEHILSELRIAGVVRSQRGSEGGFRLRSRSPTLSEPSKARSPRFAAASPRTRNTRASSQLPRVWIAVRKNLRSVVEHVTVADLANASIPDSINVLADDPEAWVNR